MSVETQPNVTRRRVFYIPGYDPHPPRRYRELYRTESVQQGRISGYRIGMEAGEDRRVSWNVAADMEGGRTLSRFEVLEWADIVQATMAQTLPATYRQLLEVAWTYVASGALRRLARLRRGPMVAGFYPVLMLLAQLGIAALMGKVAAATVTGALSRGADAAAGAVGFGAVTATGIWGALDWLLGWAIFGAVIWGVLRGFRALDHRLFAHYLMHDLAYTSRERGAWPEELQARLRTFSKRIREALAEDLDEVLVVGHSSGAALAVSAVAGALRQAGGLPANAPALSLLTLGQAIPMQSFLPRADDLRRDLHDLAGNEDLAWVDVSAPGDGCSFALCDPVAVTGVAPAGARWPLVISAAYSQTLSPERQEELKGRFFRLHFQYLCAFDRPRDYDYFRITAGPLTLGARFAGRKPSVSRIDVPASGYRSMAA